MATVTTFIDETQEHVDLAGRVVGVCNTLNFATTSVSAADVVQAVKIPANAFVTRISTIVRTAEGGTCTATVGDGTTADGWDASINLNATAGTVLRSLEATDTYGIGKLYTSADTIDLTMGHATDAAKVTVVAEFAYIDR